METDCWAPLMAELDRWQAAGRVARLWLRDDDAVEPTPALDRLLALTGEHSVPVALAVIPEQTGQALVTRLESAPLASVSVHGWSHVNHAGAGEKKQELGPQRPRDLVVDELRAGFDHLQRLYPRGFTGVLVPPWNRIAGPLLETLPGIGFRALSVFGPENPAPISMINTHVDIMDWHGTRGARDQAAIVNDIVSRLQQLTEDGKSGGVLGLLTHHLVHDQAAWDFLATLFERTSRHPGCRWLTLTDMLAEQ